MDRFLKDFITVLALPGAPSVNEIKLLTMNVPDTANTKIPWCNLVSIEQGILSIIWRLAVDNVTISERTATQVMSDIWMHLWVAGRPDVDSDLLPAYHGLAERRVLKTWPPSAAIKLEFDQGMARLDPLLSDAYHEYCGTNILLPKALWLGLRWCVMARHTFRPLHAFRANPKFPQMQQPGCWNSGNAMNALHYWGKNSAVLRINEVMDIFRRGQDDLEQEGEVK